MTFRFTERALKDYQSLPSAIQQAVDKQLKNLLSDLRYPSLRAKKYDEAEDIWQIRITRDYRSYVKIDNDTYVILRIISHPK